MVIVRHTTILLLLFTNTTHSHALVRPAALFTLAALCAASVRTGTKIVRQGSTATGVLPLLEDSQLLQTRTLCTRWISLSINVRKCVKQVSLAAIFILLARKTGTRPTTLTTCSLFGIAAGSAMTIGS